MAVDCSKCKKCKCNEEEWCCECTVSGNKVSHNSVQECKDYDEREDRDLKLECAYLGIIGICV